MVKPKIIVICGPTGIGKTATAIKMAQMFSGEIISADAMQVYRYMDIGAAKPTKAEQAAVRHHMVDIVDPDEPFDASAYSQMARKTIAALQAKEVCPIVAGGTGLYIKALLYGLFRLNRHDPAVRKRLKTEAAELGIHALHKRLCLCDPEAGARIHPNDRYRILKALEIFETTGGTITTHQNGHRFADNRFRTLKIGLHMDRHELYNRIDNRVDSMIEAGLVDEVGRLLESGYAADLKAMRSIGYRHVVDFIKGRLSWEETIRTMKRDTRRYAKRQMTWFRTDEEIVWLEPDRFTRMKRLVENFLS
jgi:tRNA dimethylallyltransferase